MLGFIQLLLLSALNDISENGYDVYDVQMRNELA